MLKKIDHFVITTTQPEACLAFYERLGFTPRAADGRYELISQNFKINVHVKGRELSPHAAKVQPGSADVCFETDTRLEQLKERLIESGLEIELGIVARTSVKGEMRSLYLRDPDGNLVELCSYK